MVSSGVASVRSGIATRDTDRLRAEVEADQRAGWCERGASLRAATIGAGFGGAGSPGRRAGQSRAAPSLTLLPGPARPMGTPVREHATCRSPGSAIRLSGSISAGNSVLIDPFLTGNPAFKGGPGGGSAAAPPTSSHARPQRPYGRRAGDRRAHRRQGRLDLRSCACGFQDKGAMNIDPMNTGGSVDQGDFTVTMVPAFHSSADFDGKTLTYLGNPHADRVEPEDGPTSITWAIRRSSATWR